MTGFVILNYNSWKLTEKLVSTLSEYKNIDIIVVVDNMSSDNSYDHLLSLKSDKTEVIQSGRNGGYSFGNNIGAKICLEKNVDIMFICNPDVMVTEEQLNRIIEAFDRNQQYAVLSGIEYNIEDKLSQPPIWKLNTYWDDVLDSFIIAKKLLKKKQKKINTSVEIQDVDIIKGSFFGVRTAAFFDIGGFDEAVFLFCEERILAKRLSKKGYRLGVVTNAKYNHNHSESINRVYKKKASQMKLLYNSRYYYNVKYNNIGLCKKIILKMAMAVSYFEFTVRDMIMQLKAKKRK